MNAYNIDWWSNGYFTVNDQGHICVRPDPQKPDALCDLDALVRERVRRGQRLPALLAFPQILVSRLHAINAAFDRARAEYQYQGKYFLVFPIKVNQSRRVLDTLTQSGESVGLEAGSKAELTAVLAHAGRTRTVIICNGYKDREYIRLALNGEKMGHKVFLVIEKMIELRIALEESQRLGIKPRLGVRARLASQGSGKWQDSGGENAKFGLDATQVLALADELKREKGLDCLQAPALPPWVRDVEHPRHRPRGAREREVLRGALKAWLQAWLLRRGRRAWRRLRGHAHPVRLLGQLRTQGVRQQRHLRDSPGLPRERAQGACDHHRVRAGALSLPRGAGLRRRGRRAQHAPCLIPSSQGGEKPQVARVPLPHLGGDAGERGRQTRSSSGCTTRKTTCRKSTTATPREFSLEQRARAEKLYLCILNEIRKRLDVTSNMSHRVLLEEIQKRMADKLYVNFSLFQSLPDAWGIGQIFPVLPLDGLNKPLTRRAVILDITCDSDGAIKKYVDGDDIETTMPFPEYDPQKPPFIGFFMVGAYQEILGNMHNLFGDTETLEVRVDSGGKVAVSLFDEGSTVADMLRYVLLDPTTLISEFSSQVVKSNLDEASQRQFIDEFRQGLFNYTYLVNEHKL